MSLHDVSPTSWSVVPRRWSSTRVNDDGGTSDQVNVFLMPDILGIL